MLDAVVHRFDVAVEHGAVARNTQPMGDAVHPDPFFPGQLPSAMVARTAVLNTSAPPPGRLVSPASFIRNQHIALADLLDPRQVRDLDRGERLDVHIRDAVP